MDRFKNLKRLQVDANGDLAAKLPDSGDGNGNGKGKAEEEDNSGLFMGMMVRRRAALLKDCKADYVGVPSDPYLTKILSKQGDRKVLFADTVMKFTGSGKMKKRIFIVTDFALYLVDPDADILKRRIALAAVDKLCLSKLNDYFFAIIIPTEYDCLMASTRRTEISHVLVQAIKSTSDYELEVTLSNRFEYNAAADMIKEVEFEEVDGGIKTKITRKESTLY